MGDIEKFERGGAFSLTKRISAAPARQDFELLNLPKGDVDDLRRCRVGDCSVKLGEETILQLRRAVDWKAADVQARVDAVMQRFALAYVTGYLEGGNEQLAVYRDAARSTAVAEEFRDSIPCAPPFPVARSATRRFPRTAGHIHLVAARRRYGTADSSARHGKKSALRCRSL